MQSLISPRFRIRAFIFSCLFLWQLPVSAAIFAVNTPSDLVDIDFADGLCITANDDCSLRAAVQQANALAGADSVSLPAGVYNLSLSGTLEDAAASGDLDITDTLTINGDGADQVFIDGMAADRVFELVKGATAVINGVTIRNGVADGLSLRGNANGGGSRSGIGGGIKSEGWLTLNDCNVDRNTAFNGGAGIHAVYRGYPVQGSLTVNRCNITNNGAGGGSGGFGGHIYAENIPITIRDSVLKNSRSSSTWGVLAGGGLFYSNSNYPYPQALVANTTISHNRAMSTGGGIHVAMGQLHIINSTISGNAAYDAGGGLNIEDQAIVTLVNSTITDNSAPVVRGGGINDRNQTSMVTITDSIVSDNMGGDCATSAAADLSTVGNNLDSDGSCGFNLANQDPLLLALADNGGPGFTHALAEGSPAIDAALGCLATDQRSYLRPASACDLGAVEMAAAPPAVPVVTPLENQQVSATNIENEPPVAFDLPAAVAVGGVLQGIMNAYDPDGDLLSYEITEQATKGRVSLPEPGSNNDIASGYTYTPLVDVGGFDSFKFRACDPYGACSDEQFIFITITNGGVSAELDVELTPNNGKVNGVVILSATELAEVAPDSAYSYPLGGYFFSVDEISQNNGGMADTVVTIQLPAETVIPDNAEVRKLDNTGVWQTMSDVASVDTSSAVLDRVNNTIILSLVDNDIFDLNPESGVINDPIALGVAASNASDSDGDGVIDSNDAYPNDATRAVRCPPGRYGAFACINAAPGYYVPAEGALTETPCAAGSFSELAGSVQCVVASIGYFVATSGQDAQTVCPLGHFSANTGALACSIAALGSYVDTVGSSSVLSCPAGTTTASSGSMSAQACVSSSSVPSNNSSAEGNNDVGGGGVFGAWFIFVLLANVLIYRNLQALLKFKIR